MTPEEFFENIRKEVPENQSLQRYLTRHPRKEHSKGTLCKIVGNLRQCEAENRLPSEIVMNALKPYFPFLRR